MCKGTAWLNLKKLFVKIVSQRKQILLKIGSDRIKFFSVELSLMYKALFAIIQNILNGTIPTQINF